MAHHLLKFGIAGVQEFIGQSRKIRDLDAASAIVSRLSETAGRALSSAGAEVLLPAGITETDSWPHQTICRVKRETHEGVRQLAEEICAAVTKAWEGMAGGAYEKHKARIDIGEDVFIKASKDWMELFWVAVPETGVYGTDFANVSARYDDRRYTRSFSPLTTFVFKSSKDRPWICSMCGRRPSVLKDDVSMKDSSGFITGKERLCASCLTKRHEALESCNRAPSTHSLAKFRFFTDTRFAALRASPGVDWQRILDVLGTEQEDRIVDPLHQKALNALKESPSFEGLPAYYGIITLDGDHMGKWVSGERPGVSTEQLAAFQQGLSGRILEMSRRIRRLSKEFDGVHLVYSGGDDALLLSPMDFLLPLIAELRKCWDETFGGDWGKSFNLPEACAPTFTLHASIVHAKSPLQAALRAANEDLARAKSYGRNRFSLAVHTSGAPSLMTAKWTELEVMIGAVEAFCNWRLGDRAKRPSAPVVLKQRAKDTLPTKLGHSLFEANVFFALAPEGADAALFSIGGYTREVARIFQHCGASQRVRAKWEEGLLGWLTERAAADLLAENGERMGGQVLVESALTMTLFLARTLHWGDDDE